MHCFHKTFYFVKEVPVHSYKEKSEFDQLKAMRSPRNFSKKNLFRLKSLNWNFILVYLAFCEPSGKKSLLIRKIAIPLICFGVLHPSKKSVSSTDCQLNLSLNFIYHFV